VGPVPVETLPDQRVEAQEQTSVADPWVTIVWNDPVNLMSYVAYVFEAYFGHPRAKAEKLMRQVHQEGRAVVSTGSLEGMEVDVQAMHGFGLWATLQRSGQ
jgi:ATP-dependent Clp protease adaptor protein ClpS